MSIENPENSPQGSMRRLVFMSLSEGLIADTTVNTFDGYIELYFRPDNDFSNLRQGTFHDWSDNELEAMMNNEFILCDTKGFIIVPDMIVDMLGEQLVLGLTLAEALYYKMPFTHTSSISMDLLPSMDEINEYVEEKDYEILPLIKSNVEHIESIWKNLATIMGLNIITEQEKS